MRPSSSRSTANQSASAGTSTSLKAWSVSSTASGPDSASPASARNRSRSRSRSSRRTVRSRRARSSATTNATTTNTTTAHTSCSVRAPVADDGEITYRSKSRVDAPIAIPPATSLPTRAATTITSTYGTPGMSESDPVRTNGVIRIGPTTATAIPIQRRLARGGTKADSLRFICASGLPVAAWGRPPYTSTRASTAPGRDARAAPVGRGARAPAGRPGRPGRPRGADAGGYHALVPIDETPEHTVADAASAAADETVEAIEAAAEENRAPVVAKALDDAALKAGKTVPRVGWLRALVRRLIPATSGVGDDAASSAS